MISTNFYNAVKNECENFKNLITNDIDFLEKNSKLKIISNDTSESKADPKSIDCEPATLDEKRFFYNLLMSEDIM